MNIRPKNNEVEVEIVGGLGNQLFGYFAGLYLSELNASNLNLKICQPNINESTHGDSITELSLEGNFFFEKQRNIFQLNSKRLFEKLSRSSQIFAFIGLHLNKRYISSEIGFDRNLQKLATPIVLSGYFQSWKYFYAVKDKINQPLEIINPSEWYRKLATQASHQDPVMLHIRRGDYTNPINFNFGLLSGNYYRKALEVLPENFKLKPIWVFSDDLDQAQETLKDLSEYNFIWIKQPISTSAVESLLLMSLGCANIIANSTYSWWGAMLNSRDQIVIAPGTWFRNQEEPLDLIPEAWIRVQSDWV